MKIWRFLMILFVPMLVLSLISCDDNKKSDDDINTTNNKIITYEVVSYNVTGKDEDYTKTYDYYILNFNTKEKTVEMKFKKINENEVINKGTYVEKDNLYILTVNNVDFNFNVDDEELFLFYAKLKFKKVS